MKYQHAFAPVEAEGMSETVSFTIAASGKAFRSLMDSLYSRKIEAPIRELATNAFDSHKAAALIRPFAIHLPNQFEPVFRVRDYGTGMPHDLVMRRYTTLFDSTKDESNEEVGMLGLGSKSPFAYTDAFVLTVWLDGEKRTYAIYIGSQGQPKCSLVDTSASDEECGVAVEFPVKVGDITAFEEAAIRVFKGFPIMPDGLPATVQTALSIQPFDTGDFWKGYDKKYLGGGFFARQGCVLYPIDLKHLLPEAEAKAFGGVDGSIVLDFPIGSLEFTNSREFLSYSPDTVKALKKQFQRFRRRIDTACEEHLSSCKTAWERRCAMRSTDLFSTFGGLFRHAKVIIEAEKIANFIHQGLGRDRNDINRRMFSLVKDMNNVFYHRDAYGCPRDIPASVCFVYRDTPKGKLPGSGNARIGHHLKLTGTQYAYTMDRLSIANWRAMGCPPILRLSKLPLPPRTYQSTGGGGGSFDRYKVVAKNGCLTAVEAKPRNCLFAYLNRGYIATPTGCPDWRLEDVIALSRLLKRTTGQQIAFINIRSNEPFEKFGDVPLFYGCEDKIIASLKRRDIRNAITVLNASRFRGSIYHAALHKFDEKDLARDRNPLFDLRRFTHREDKLDDLEISAWNEVMNGAGMIRQLFRDPIIDIATSMGMEILPERVTFQGWYRKEFPYPLLPKKWERFVTHITSPFNSDYFQFMKDHFSC